MTKTSFRSFKVKMHHMTKRISIQDQVNDETRFFRLPMGAVPTEQAEKVLKKTFEIEISGYIPMADGSTILLTTDFSKSIA